MTATATTILMYLLQSVEKKIWILLHVLCNHFVYLIIVDYSYKET